MIYRRPITNKLVCDFIPWQPSTWPETPPIINQGFLDDFKTIIDTTVLAEIENVIDDATSRNGDLQHRGHVVAIVLLCAVDVLSSYAFRDPTIDECSSCHRSDSVGPRYKNFIKTFFPDGYKPFADQIYGLYRNSMVHSWHLFKVGITPGNDPLVSIGDIMQFGLINFYEALRFSTEEFLGKVAADPDFQRNVLKRYQELRDSAR